MENKRGMITIQLIFLIFIAFFVLIFLGVTYFGFSLFHTQIQSISDFSLGNISFQESYEDTLGAGIESFTNMLNWMALGTLLGMVFVMTIVGYSFQTRSRLMIVLDIGIILVAFTLAVLISQSFETFINSSDAFLDIFSTEFYASSRFLLNLPIYVTIVGAFIMIVSYGSVIIRRKEGTVYEYTE